MNKLILVLALAFAVPTLASAQERIKIHSHNDYEKKAPFYLAYSQELASVEADVFYKDGKLLVGHEESELATAQTIEEMYIDPIVKAFKRNGNRPWKDSENTLTLLVDLKTPATPTLDELIKVLNKYPDVFQPAKNKYAVRVIVSGNRPEPANFSKYPDFIMFDGDRTDYSAEELKKIAMISFSLRELTDWNGKGTFIKSHKEAIEAKIDAVHKLGKPIRFWATPDGLTAWNTMHTMGVDFINTDDLAACAAFFNNFENKNYIFNGEKQSVSDHLSRATRLDKATVGFQGFNNKLLQMSGGIDVYQPTYKNDGVKGKVKNVIYLIGDGMSITQQQVAATVNNAKYKKGNGLSLFNIKSIGFQNTSSRDAYTTDSAAGGSALATGEEHNNRHVSMTHDNKPVPSLTDFMYADGRACGVVTLGNLADATPAAFYGHSTERDHSDEITSYLTEGKLTLLNGSGMKVLTDRKDGKDLIGELKKQYRISTTIDDINADDQKVICADERMDLAASEETITLLADATKAAIEKLSKASGDKGFFLMVEGAKIDYAGHAKSLPGSVVEMLSFDLVIKEALKFADSNGETLIVITGDHETGGLVLVDGDYNTGHIIAQHITDDHTPVMLPVYAYGPGSHEFMGVYRNIEIFKKIMDIVGLKK